MQEKTRGVGAYGDLGADTMGHIAKCRNYWDISNPQKLDFANLHHLNHVEPAEHPTGYYTMMNEQSNGKDTRLGIGN